MVELSGTSIARSGDVRGAAIVSLRTHNRDVRARIGCLDFDRGLQLFWRSYPRSHFHGRVSLLRGRWAYLRRRRRPSARRCILGDNRSGSVATGECVLRCVDDEFRDDGTEAKMGVRRHEGAEDSRTLPMTPATLSRRTERGTHERVERRISVPIKAACPLTDARRRSVPVGRGVAQQVAYEEAKLPTRDIVDRAG